ncbi:MAG: hypothetical protein AB1722_12400 [Pseudomonadota bacterium]
MSKTHQQIIDQLKGCSSTNPMPFEQLLDKTGLQADTLHMVLHQMQHSVPASINSASVTKQGKTQLLIWPTGVLRDSIPYRVVSDQIANRNRELKQQQEQETTMPKNNRGSKPGALNSTLYSLIEQTPGIAHETLVKDALHQYPGETEAHIAKTLSNMVHATKKIVSEGPRGQKTYRIADAPAPAHEPQAATSAAAKPSDDETLHISIDDKNVCLISTQHIDLELTAAQTARLHAFMHRVQLEAV